MMSKRNTNQSMVGCVLCGAVFAAAWSGVAAEQPAGAAERRVLQETGQETLAITVNAETLSANIQAVPLKRVLNELARQIPLEVRYNDEQVGKQRITDAFSELPLEAGIKRLLKNTSHVLSYSGAESVDDGRVKRRKMEVRIATSDTGAPGLNVQGSGTPGNDAAEAQLQALIKQALHGPTPKERKAALKALQRQFKEDEILPTFVDALKDEDPEVRKLTLGLLTTFKERVPMSAVAEIGLNAKEDRDFRNSALLYVGHRYLSESVPVLQQAFADPDRRVRQRARVLLKIINTGVTHEDLARARQQQQEEERELEQQEEERELEQQERDDLAKQALNE